MTVSREQFVESLTGSGVLTDEDLQRVLARMPEEQQPQSAEDLARFLCREGLLTNFQAHNVYAGKAHGLVFGEYVVQDVLGHGGMGQVYRACHRRMKRTVALKVLSGEVSHAPDAASRFQQEVEAAARLLHPNIVTAFDAGEAHGVQYLVMEYVEGKDLAALLAEHGPLSVPAAVDCILQAAKGLQYAHQAGVIHRDIKPSNLLLHRHGAVKILDMGLARVRRSSRPDEATASERLTASGAIIGTVDYMAPEQAASTREATERSDIYSLGCTLFTLLTGRPLYDGATPLERIVAHRDQPIPSLRSIRSDVPPALDRVFQTMVAKKPGSRQASMAVVIQELLRCGIGPHHRLEAPWAGAPAAGGAPTAEAAGGTTVAHSGGSNRPAAGMPAARRRELRHAQAQELGRRRDVRVAYSQAIHDYDRQRRHQRTLKLLGKILRTTSSVVLPAALLIGSLVAGYHFYTKAAANRSILERSASQVIAAVNDRLLSKRVEPLQELHFAEETYFGTLPVVLRFDTSAKQDIGANRRPEATIRGRFHRDTGLLECDIDFHVGADVRGLELPLSPVE